MMIYTVLKEVNGQLYTMMNLGTYLSLEQARSICELNARTFGEDEFTEDDTCLWVSKDGNKFITIIPEWAENVVSLDQFKAERDGDASESMVSF